VGSFDINQTYDKRVSELRYKWSMDTLRLLKAAPLRKAYKTMMAKGGGDIAAKVDLDDARAALACSQDLNHIELMTSPLENLKERGFCDSSPPFPLFIEYHEAQYRFQVRFVRKINSSHLRKCLYSGATTSGTIAGNPDIPILKPFWLLSVPELQCLGHFSKALSGELSSDAYGHLLRLLMNEDTCPRRQHVFSNYHFWNDPDNIGSIDEIIRWNEHRFWPEESQSMSPRQLLNALREHERERMMGPNIRFTYLDELPDKGRLKVLRSSHAIHRAADQLKNCASSYIDDVEMMKAILILLEDNNGKAVALGLHPLRGEWTQEGWEQICEASSRQPSKESMDKFHGYSKIFRRWHRDTFVPIFCGRRDQIRLQLARVVPKLIDPASQLLVDI